MYVCDQYGIFRGGGRKLYSVCEMISTYGKYFLGGGGGGGKLYRTAEWISPVFKHIPRWTGEIFFSCIVHP